MRRFADFLIAAALLAALAGALAVYRDDQAGRLPARQFLSSFRVAKRRPDIAKTVSDAPSADWTADIVADAALQDAYATVDLGALDAESRAAWIDAMARIQDELEAARAALLESIAIRPGWPFHQSLLGQVVFTLDDQHLQPELIRRSDLWSLPLLRAADAAPAVSGLWQTLAAAYLRTWPALKSAHARTAPRVFRAAFMDADFVHDAFGSAAALIGKKESMLLLPDSAKPLHAAFDYFARQNDIDDAASVGRRWEVADWQERARDLAVIEQHARRGDVDDVRTLCAAWLAQHSPRDFDSPAAQAQVARVLDLWPGGRLGEWYNSPVAEACRYVLTRNDDATRIAPIVARLIDNFDDVPLSFVATVKALAGQAAEAERIAQSAEESSSLEWAPFRLALARSYLRTGHPKKAAAACDQLPAAAMDTHEALLVRSAVARAHGDQAGSTALLLEANRDLVPFAPACGEDPLIAVYGALEPRIVRIRLTGTTPLLVDVDVNDARRATIRITGERIETFTLRSWRDQMFSFRVVSGNGEVCAAVI